MADTDSPVKGVVQATGTSSRSGGLTGKMIEAAMVKATEDCAAAGITDPAEVLKHKLAARERVKAEVRAKAEAEAEAAREAGEKARAEALARLGKA